jgi:hypothetical protein
MQRTQLHIERNGGKLKVSGQYVEDASPILVDCSVARAKEEQLRIRKDAEYRRIASIPFTLALKIKAEHGVDPLRLKTKADTQKYLAVLQRHYPKFLTTNKRVSRPRERVRFAHGTL